MKKYICVILSLLLAFAENKISAQSVVVDATIDSLQILIGQQTKIKLQVSLDSDKRAIFPIYTDTLVRGVEMLDIAKPDTQLLNEGRRALITQEYTITSFDSALYYLPPMEVLVDNKPYYSKPLALKVYSVQVPIDTLHPDWFFGPKTIMQVPFVWQDWYLVIACGLLFFPFLILLIFLIIRIRDNKPIIRKVKVEPKLPPAQLAMNKLEHIKNEKSWETGYIKEYYTNITEALRSYISERFGFNALEMTSSEIIDKLLETNDKEALSDLRTLFQTADLVKFAKYVPMLDENDANLLSAVAFINKTKQEVPEAEREKPHDVVIEEPRSKRQKRILLAVIILVAAACIAFVMLSAMEIKEMLF